MPKLDVYEVGDIIARALQRRYDTVGDVLVQAAVVGGSSSEAMLDIDILPAGASGNTQPLQSFMVLITDRDEEEDGPDE